MNGYGVQHETANGRYLFEFDYTVKEFVNSRGSGFADDYYNDVEVEVSNVKVYALNEQDHNHVEITGGYARVVAEWHSDELCEAALKDYNG